jgi:hypothetical protein
MKDVFYEYSNYIRKKFNAEPGFMTMNLPKMVNILRECEIENPVICSSINKAEFRMSGGKELYEKIIAEEKFKCVAMQVLAAGAIKPEEAFEYVCRQKGILSILFGSSSFSNIKKTKELVQKYSL